MESDRSLAKVPSCSSQAAELIGVRALLCHALDHEASVLPQPGLVGVPLDPLLTVLLEFPVDPTQNSDEEGR